MSVYDGWISVIFLGLMVMDLVLANYSSCIVCGYMYNGLLGYFICRGGISQGSASPGFGVSGVAALSSLACASPIFSGGTGSVASASISSTAAVSSGLLSFSAGSLTDDTISGSSLLGLLFPLFVAPSSLSDTGFDGDGASFNAVADLDGLSFVGDESSSSPSAIAATELENECVLLCRRVVAPVDSVVVVSESSGFVPVDVEESGGGWGFSMGFVTFVGSEC